MVLANKKIATTITGGGMKSATIVIVLMICHFISIAEAKDTNTRIPEIVVKHMVRLLPATIKKICVMQMDPSMSTKNEGPFLKFKHTSTNIDKRIEQDPTSCDDMRPEKSMKSIIYFGEDSNDYIDRAFANGLIKGTDSNSYGELRKFKSKRYVLVSSCTDECGADVFGFIFKRTSSKAQLIRMIKIGPVVCMKKGA